MKFTLVIPALNEEEAIGSTLERALAARESVVKETSIDEMLVVFVNDGSTDGTQAIVDKFPEVIKVRFETNRGYGAAIKAGFAATDADLVGFMDADGTCDPLFFTQLINRLDETGADIVSGNRMTAQSEMPALRRLGNQIFARLIRAVSGKKVLDSASGMRVIPRSSLPKLHPLPDGLHYTPAMTCLAMMDPRLSISEVDMSYKERVGESKLHVLKDGLRFLGIILFTAALFTPLVSLTILGGLFLLFGLGICGVAQYFGQDGTITLIQLCAFIAVALQAVFIGFLCHQVLHMLLGLWEVNGQAKKSILLKFFWTRRMVWGGAILLGLSLGLLGISLTPVIGSALKLPVGIVAGFGVLISGWLALGGVILRVIWAAKERRIADRLGRPPEPVAADADSNPLEDAPVNLGQVEPPRP